ncbi:MAG: 50S ribosomal protein L10 [Candidatus Zipacnadales bacterium]
MPTPRKEQIVMEVKKALAESTGVIVISYGGLSVPLMTQFRSQLRRADGRMMVVKNRLAKLALAGTEADTLNAILIGPNALVFCSGDIPSTVKFIADFAKEHGGIEFRASYLDGVVYNAVQTRALATVPSKEELLSSIVGALNAPLSGLVFVLQAILRDFVYTLKAIADKQAETAA